MLRKADVLKFVEDVLSSRLPRQADIVIYDKQRRSLAAYGTSLCNARQERIGVLAVFREVHEHS